MTTFAIANRSTSSITIAYGPRALARSGCLLNDWSLDGSAPAIAEVSSLHWWRSSPRWQPLDEGALHFDPTTCQVIFDLEPGKVARLYEEVNAPDPTPDACGEFCFLRLEIRTSGGTIGYSGLELLRAFRKQGGLWLLSYTS
jgi:hypothetical protein